MFRRFILLIAAFAAPASAQNTRCQLQGDVLDCRTSPTIDWGTYLQQRQEQERQTQAIIDAQRQEQNREVADSYRNALNQIAQQKAERAGDIRKAVGEMMAAGDCRGAQEFALTTGEIELAGQVQAYCATKRR